MSITINQDYVLVDGFFDSRKRLVKRVHQNPTTGSNEYIDGQIKNIKPVNNVLFQMIRRDNGSGGTFPDGSVYLSYYDDSGQLKYVGYRPPSGHVTVSSLGNLTFGTSDASLLDIGQ